MGIVRRDNAEHYVWGEVCDGWHLVRSSELSVIEERMPPQASEQRHYHSRSRQFFFVLSGELSLELDGTTHVLTAEAGLEVPPQMPHQVMNRSDSEVWFLVVSTPPSHGDRNTAPELKSSHWKMSPAY